jgi:hypothetical protein
MAEKGKTESPGLGLGAILLLVILGVFIIWVFTGGPNKKTETTKVIEESVWPPDSGIPTYGTIENN